MGQNLKVSVSLLVAGMCMFNLVSAAPASGSDKLTGVYELEVVADYGGVSVERYLPKRTDFRKQMMRVYKERMGKRFIASQLPVSSPSLSIGRVSAQEAAEVPFNMISRPVFIVGYDPVSLNWLRSNRDLLTEKKAVGLVVNVETVAQLNKMQDLVGDQIKLQPTSGERFAKNLGIKHYPFYMDQDGVMR